MIESHDRSLEVRVFIRNQHRLNIDLQSENYAVDDKFECNIVYFSLILKSYSVEGL